MSTSRVERGNNKENCEPEAVKHDQNRDRLVAGILAELGRKGESSASGKDMARSSPVLEGLREAAVAGLGQPAVMVNQWIDNLPAVDTTPELDHLKTAGLCHLAEIPGNH